MVEINYACYNVKTDIYYNKYNTYIQYLTYEAYDSLML